jgi:hypothetical protein
MAFKQAETAPRKLSDKSIDERLAVARQMIEQNATASVERRVMATSIRGERRE